MDRLQDVVIFAGKNGSGKSRLLELIKNNILPPEYRTLLQNRKQLLNQLVNFQINSGMYDASSYYKQTKDQRARLDEINGQLPFIVVDINPLVFRKSKLLKPDYRKKDNNHPNTDFEFDFESINEHLLGFLNSELQIFSTITNPKFNESFTSEKIQEAELRFCRLQSLLFKLIGEEIKPGTKGKFSLFGFENQIDHLSKGQEVILQIIVHLFKAEIDQKAILFLDEPENHLHPDVLIKLIEALLEKYTGKVQLFIATHSIPLIAHYQDKTLYYLHDGNVTYAGDKPQLVLEGLLGDEEERERLRTFVSLPEIMAANNYAYQCLFEPVTVGTNPQDRQVKQIKELLKTGKKLKVLDFGAGQGRLLDSIYEGEKNNGDITEWLDYYAYDTSPKNKGKCIDALSKVYSNAEERYYANEGAILSAGRCRFDVVVMCNVLHEIDPKDWETLFGEEGFIYKALNDDGYLLIVEDEHIPVGEKAYNNGFILLRPEELQTLFNTNEAVKHDYYDNNNRLVAMQVPKNWLIGYTRDTRYKCLKEIQNRAKAEIDRIRKIPEPSYKDGLKHALYVQQLANTTLALT